MYVPSAKFPYQMAQVRVRSLLFVLTCGACPEQYDVYRQQLGAPPTSDPDTLQGWEQVGYLRLRHGNCTVSCPDYGGTVVYSTQPLGDGLFEAGERAKHLRKAAKRIERWLLQHELDAVEQRTTFMLSPDD